MSVLNLGIILPVEKKGKQCLEFISKIKMDGIVDQMSIFNCPLSRQDEKSVRAGQGGRNSFVYLIEVFGKCLVAELNFKTILRDTWQYPSTPGG